MDWKKICLGIFVLVVLFFILNSILGSGDNVISGADDFKVDSPFSEDNFILKNGNDENMFIAKDYDGNTLNIEKLDDNEFKNIVSPDFRNETYSLYSVTPFDEENNIYFYNLEGLFCLCEIVEVNGNKYKIIIGDCSGNSLLFENNKDKYPLKLQEWHDYLIEFNKVNKVKVLKVL